MQKALTPLIASLLILLAFTAHAEPPLEAAMGKATDAAATRHLLDRTGFGPSPDAVAEVQRLGVENYIEAQLNPDLLALPVNLSSRVHALERTRGILAQKGSASILPNSLEILQEDIGEKEILARLSDAKLLQAILSPRQLQEVMVDFWYNFFNINAWRKPENLLVGRFEQNVIRPNVFGKFRDMLAAAIANPALIAGTENFKNADPNGAFANPSRSDLRNTGIQPDLARQILDRYTVGPHYYTDQDVQALAHILTGWGLRPGSAMSNMAYFQFQPRLHDASDKIFMKTVIKGSGQPEVQQALNLLITLPATAQHVAMLLAQNFVADQPPQSLIDKLAATFKTTDGDIRAMLRQLFLSPEFWSARYQHNKFKSPFRYVVSAFRASGAAADGYTRIVASMLEQMHEPLYRCSGGPGYLNLDAPWLSKDALAQRVAFAHVLTHDMGAFNADFLQSITQPDQPPLPAAGSPMPADNKAAAQNLLSGKSFLYY